MTDFEIVPESMRDAPRRPRSRPLGPLNAAIVAGETVFVPLNGSNQRDIRSPAAATAKRYGLRVITFRTERDGVEGLVMWAEAKVNR